MPSIKTVKLGATGPEVFPIALGCMGFSGMYGPTDDDEVHRKVPRRALQQGDAMHQTVPVPRLAPSKMSAMLLLSSLVACSGGNTVLPAGTIDARGGTLTSSDGRATLTIPAGALSEAKAITVTPTTAAGAIAGTTYDFKPDGLTFAQPVSLAIRYDAASLPAGAAQDDIRLVQIVEPTWKGIVGSSVDTAAKVVRGSVSHFSTYAGISYVCADFQVLVEPNIPLIAPGATQQFAVHLIVSGRRVDVTPFATFRSSAPNVATIIASGPSAGLATGVGLGITTITATYGRCIPNEYSTTMTVFSNMDGGGGADAGVVTDAGVMPDAGAGACSPACPSAGTCSGTTCRCSSEFPICGRSGSNAGTCCGAHQECINDQCVQRTMCRFPCSGVQTCQNGLCVCPDLPSCGALCNCPIGQYCRNGTCQPLDAGLACDLPAAQCSGNPCCVGTCVNRACECGVAGGQCTANPNFCCSGVCLPPDSSGTRLCGCSPQGGYCRQAGDCCGGRTCDMATKRCN